MIRLPMALLGDVSAGGARSTASRRAGVFGAMALVVVAAATSFACGTEPVGVEACKKIEKVRCESAQACSASTGIDLTQPVHEGDDPVNNVAACIRYYDDQCLHGLVASEEPSPQAVDACVNAIINGDCTIVKEPESHPACHFLEPPAQTSAPPADAAVEATATDAATTD